MRDLYNAVKAELAKIDFNAIWPGFAPINFAIIDGDTAYLEGREVPRGDNLWGCTVREFEGKLLAIWTLSERDTGDAQILAGNIVHEMFHGFQVTQNYPMKEGGCEFAMMFFPDNLTAYRLKAAEANLLANAYINSDRNALDAFFSLRQSRWEILGDTILAEFANEEHEGMAEYAGLCALQQLSPEKFEKYVAETHLQLLQNPTETLFAVRRFAYSTGAILYLALKKLGVDFYHIFTDAKPLSVAISTEDSVATAFDKHVAIKQAKFDDFLAGETKTIEKNARFLSFDPMNMWRIGDQIFCQWGIGFADEVVKEPLILNMEPGSQRQVVSIVKRK